MGPSSFWLPQLLLADLELVDPCNQWVGCHILRAGVVNVRGFLGGGGVTKPCAYLKVLLTAAETDDVSVRVSEGVCAVRHAGGH